MKLALALLLATSGCVIGTWRMHPGAAMARVDDECTGPVTTEYRSDGTYWSCPGGAVEVPTPSPVAWSLGVFAGRGTSTVGTPDSPEMSLEADGEVSYVLPNDRLAFGVQATYLRDLMNSPDGKNYDAVTGWGGAALVHFALTRRIVLHAGAGALEAKYVLTQGTASEADSGSELAPRGLAGVTFVLARSKRRDLFFTAQAEYVHMSDAMVGGRQLGYGNVMMTGALGLALAP